MVHTILTLFFHIPPLTVLILIDEDRSPARLPTYHSPFSFAEPNTLHVSS